MVKEMLAELYEQHIMPLEQRLAHQEQLLSAIGNLVRSTDRERPLQEALAQLLKSTGASTDCSATPEAGAVESLYRYHVDFDKNNAENDKEYEILLRTDNVGWWRYRRFFEPVFDCLGHTKNERWLTVGDPFGTDAYQMMREGFRHVLPTNIGDHLLKESVRRGLIKEYGVENAESLSFADNSFDYVLCKEAYHHFPRPTIALYEMLRVARKAVVLIEPQDPLIDHPAYIGNVPAGYEVSGNYVYTLSRRELTKVALGLDLPALATRGHMDLWYPGASEIVASEEVPEFVQYRSQVQALEKECAQHQKKHNYLLAIIFKERPQIDINQYSPEWSITFFPGNPHLAKKEAA